MKKIEFLKLVALFMGINILIIFINAFISIASSGGNFELHSDFLAERLTATTAIAAIFAVLGALIGAIIPKLLYHPNRKHILVGSEASFSLILILILFSYSSYGVSRDSQDVPLPSDERALVEDASTQGILTYMMKKYESQYLPASNTEKERMYSDNVGFIKDNLSAFKNQDIEFKVNRVEAYEDRIRYFRSWDPLIIECGRPDGVSFTGRREKDTSIAFRLTGNFYLSRPSVNEKGALVIYACPTGSR
ncbi:hypothetical protein [Flaviaesturariibacter amylovorans]|uniref:Uncharacterized protein n=1 Tax=Flaviaesturariibacter amylovorans TaxID=1084520 RepID=A0ABP8HN07_9BACT